MNLFLLRSFARPDEFNWIIFIDDDFSTNFARFFYWKVIDCLCRTAPNHQPRKYNLISFDETQLKFNCCSRRHFWFWTKIVDYDCKSNFDSSAQSTSHTNIVCNDCRQQSNERPTKRTGRKNKKWNCESNNDEKFESKRFSGEINARKMKMPYRNAGTNVW